MSKTVKVKLYRSVIGNPEWMRVIVRTMGLRKTQQEVTMPDNAAVRGMVNKVPHLLRLIEAEETK